MSKNKYDEDGNIICPVCNGTAYDDNVMERYTNFVCKEDLRKYGVHFCGNCGVVGKIDWVDYSRGVRFDEMKDDVDMYTLNENITSFVALYSLTEYKDWVPLLNGVIRHEQREFIFDDINREIDPYSNDDNTYFLASEIFPTAKDVHDFDPDIIEDLNIYGKLWRYLMRSARATSALLVVNTIHNYFEMNVLPTKGMDEVRNVVNELYDDPDEPIHLLIDDLVRSALNYAAENADNFAYDMNLGSFDDIVKLVKDAEERTRYVASRKELEEKGVLFFD